MIETTLLPMTPTTDQEYQTAIAYYLRETQGLLDEMQDTQDRLETLRERARLSEGELVASRRYTQEILTRLEAAF